jgi:hypothetical protein
MAGGFMQGPAPLTLTLDLSRAERADRPFEFVFAPQTYRLHSAGGGVTEATFPWDQALLADLAAMQEAGRDPASVQRFGDRLREFLATTRWPVVEAQLCEAVNQRRPVVVTIRAAAAELYALPWELLTIEATGQHIGEIPEVLVRYEWPETATARRAELSTGPGRLLFAWSGHVPAAEHQAAIAEACAAGPHSFDVDQDALPDASCGRLSGRLDAATKAGRPFEVLHLLCHGTATGSAFGLALEDDESPGRVVAVDAGRLRQILAPHAATLRLVVLAACDSGNVGVLGNQLGSVAQDLHRAGIAAVVASRFPLSVSGSRRLARTLYLALLQESATLEEAFLAARRHLAEDAGQLDWASLQLYARAADGSETRLAGPASLEHLRTPQIREQLSQFRTLFSGARKQIALLGRYKAFHDVLQELEVPFNAIERDKKRLLASPEASGCSPRPRPGTSSAIRSRTCSSSSTGRCARSARTGCGTSSTCPGGGSPTRPRRWLRRWRASRRSSRPVRSTSAACSAWICRARTTACSRRRGSWGSVRSWQRCDRS